MMSTWTARLMFGCAIWLTGAAHHDLVSGVTNTPAGMFVYHGAAAGIDFLLLVCAANLLEGRLSSDMQNLCWLSMIVNFFGWLLYLAYAPPISYNYAIGVLGYAQLARLIYLGPYGIDPAGEYRFCGHDFGSPQLHYEKAKR